MFTTPEAVNAEMNYRLERAQAAAALAQHVSSGRPSWVRRLWRRSARTPVRRVTPVLP